nr:hypothetical protein CFP56_30648 [Quercus suber]
MTAGPSQDPRAETSYTSRAYVDHSLGQRINTDAVIVKALRTEYPKLHLAVAPQGSCNISAYAATGHASLAPIDNERDRMSWRVFLPPAQRLNGERGVLASLTKFAKYMLDWQGKEFILVVAEGRDGSQPYPAVTNQYILSASVEATNKLLFEVGSWSNPRTQRRDMRRSLQSIMREIVCPGGSSSRLRNVSMASAACWPA